MNKRISILLTLTVGCVLGAALSAYNASADSIIIHGRSYNEVLVYKTNNNYYVKIPDEGRVIHAALDEVDADSVKIIDDFMYRRKLRRYFDAVAKGDEDEARRIREASRTSQAQLAESRLREIAEEARLRTKVTAPTGVISIAKINEEQRRGGRSVAPGINISRATFESTLGSMGFTITKGALAGGNPTTVAKAAGGGITITAYGPDDRLNRVKGSIAGTMEQVGASMGQMAVVLGMLAPWSPAVLQANGARLQAGGVLDETQNGVRIFLETKMQPPNVEATFVIETVL